MHKVDWNKVIEVIFSNLVAISYWENYCINVAWHILNIYNIYSILYVRYTICVMIKPQIDDNLLNIFLSNSWYRNVHYAPFIFIFLSLSLSLLSFSQHQWIFLGLRSNPILIILFLFYSISLSCLLILINSIKQNKYQ